MQQLSGIDNMFLQLERDRQHMHVAGLGIYDPSIAPDGKVRFKDILKFFSARTEQFPHFRRRLVTAPLSIHSLTPDTAEELDETVPVRVAEREPTPREIYARAALNAVGRLPELTRISLRTAGRLAVVGADVARRTAGNPAQLKANLASFIAGDPASVLTKRPAVTRFGGALHRYLSAKGELPATPIGSTRLRPPAGPRSASRARSARTSR